MIGANLKVVLPLMRAALGGAAALIFVLLTHEFAASVLVRSSTTQVMGTVLYDYWGNGSYPLVAAIALVMSVVTAVGVVIAVHRRRQQGAQQPLTSNARPDWWITDMTPGRARRDSEAIDGRRPIAPRAGRPDSSSPSPPATGSTRTPKRAETVARAITRDIIRDGRQPGDPLPPEATMLAQYNVSRESLREALRLLEVQGLVAIRRGPAEGRRSCTVDPANLGRVSTLYYHLAGATYRELWEAWVLAESLLAERAAANPDDAARAAAMAPYLDDGGADARRDASRSCTITSPSTPPWPHSCRTGSSRSPCRRWARSSATTSSTTDDPAPAPGR